MPIEKLEILPAEAAVRASVRPPGSKSITNRALICAALADGESRLSGALASDDTRVMIDGLRRLGVAVDETDSGRTLVVQGHGPPDAEVAELFVGNSGTTVRFLTAMLATGTGSYRLDGVSRMRERPIGDLIAALNGLGADIASESGNGCPPLVVQARGLRGGVASVRGDASSQFVSALLMAAPYSESSIRLSVAGDLVSKPYIRMTSQVMEAFGVRCEIEEGMRAFRVPQGRYVGREYAIEPDASAASYFWGAAAITGGDVTVEGLSADAMQGDVQFVGCLEKMGCRVEWLADAVRVAADRPLQGVEVDMNAISDTAQTLAAVALFADGPTRITGVAHNRLKETDRIGNLAIELRKLGADVETSEDGLQIMPGPLQPAEIETYDDHRMAMSLALVGLRQPGVVIRDPGCTAKTYPGFFQDLRAVCEAFG
ncbi:MAG: 3-phosphoshikimate 1-carboxyvinyltransferase [Planctomycetota bacterium]